MRDKSELFGILKTKNLGIEKPNNLILRRYRIHLEEEVEGRTTEPIYLPYLDIKGKEHAFSRIIPAQYIQLGRGGTHEIHIESVAPHIQQKWLERIYEKYIPHVGEQLQDQTWTIDPVAAQVKILQDRGHKVTGIKSGQYTVVSDFTLPYDERLLERDASGNYVWKLDGTNPAEPKIFHKVIGPDRFGNYKVAVNPAVMGRFNIDQDGDISVVNEIIGLTKKGTKFQIHGHIKAPFQKPLFDVRTPELHSSKDVYGILRAPTKKEFIDLFKFHNKLSQEMILSRTMQLSKEDALKQLDKSIVKDIVGRVVNAKNAEVKAYALQVLEDLAARGSTSAIANLNNPVRKAIWVAGFGHIPGIAKGLGDRATGVLNDSTERIIRGVQRNAGLDVDEAFLQHTIGIMEGTFEVANSPKHLTKRGLNRIVDLIEQLSSTSTDALARASIEHISGVGLGLKHFGPKGAINSRIPIVPKRSLPLRQGPDILQNLMDIGVVQRKSTELGVDSLPLPLRGQINSMEMMWYEHLNAENIWTPLGGGLTKTYKETGVKQVAYLHPVINYGEDGTVMLSFGDEFLKDQLSRNIDIEQYGIRDYRLKRTKSGYGSKGNLRLPGEVRGRFDRDWLLSHEGMSDLNQLSREIGVESHILHNTLGNDMHGPAALRKAVLQYDLKTHQYSIDKAVKGITEHASKFSVQVLVEEAKNGVHRITEYNRNLLKAFVGLDARGGTMHELLSDAWDKFKGLLIQDVRFAKGTDSSIGKTLWAHTDGSSMSGSEGNLLDPRREIQGMFQSIDRVPVKTNVAYVIGDIDKLAEVQMKYFPGRTKEDIARGLRENIHTGKQGVTTGFARITEQGADDIVAGFAGTIVNREGVRALLENLPSVVIGKMTSGVKVSPHMEQGLHITDASGLRYGAVIGTEELFDHDGLREFLRQLGGLDAERGEIYERMVNGDMDAFHELIAKSTVKATINGHETNIISAPGMTMHYSNNQSNLAAFNNMGEGYGVSEYLGGEGITEFIRTATHATMLAGGLEETEENYMSVAQQVMESVALTNTKLMKEHRSFPAFRGVKGAVKLGEHLTTTGTRVLGKVENIAMRLAELAAR